MMASFVKRFQRSVAWAATGLESISVQWLTVVIALNTFSQLWRAYTSIDLDSSSSNRSRRNGGTGDMSDSSGLLVLCILIISYLGLALQLILVPVFLIRFLLMAIHHRLRVPFSPKHAIEFVCLLPVSVFSTCSNLSGIIDITSAPLLADIAFVLWRVCALPSLALAVLVAPIYIFVCVRASRIQRRQRDAAVEAQHAGDEQSTTHQLLPWYLLLLPSIVASSTASDLTLILEPKDASNILMLAFVLWGSSIGPSLIFTGGYIKQLVTNSAIPARQLRNNNLSDFTFPLAPLAQLALGIMTLGIQSRRIWADTVGPARAPLLLGEIAMAVGAMLGLVLWAISAAWFINSHMLVILKHWRRRNNGARDGRSEAGAQSPGSGGQLLRTAASGSGWHCGKLDMCAAVYPVGSFALATVYVTHIWSSFSALVLTQMLLWLLTLLMLAIFARSAMDSVRYVINASRRRQAPGGEITTEPLLAYNGNAAYGAI
ncbi:hypothetical protein GQ54DRAFT_45785 [Martensiomyces pterosporus]|nr:hypothetical protein GQ54DRAFT_45785 [Martensiomyces pterosporus]